MSDILTGIRVIDLTWNLAGPFCTALLADMGAEVIKIEPPWGDMGRMGGPSSSVTIKRQSPYFMWLNRNKKGVVLNLKNEKAVKILKDLVKVSDVVVENMRPGTMDKLEIGYKNLKKVNPGIIYAALSGYGQYGPYINRPSYDIIGQAMSGWMYLQGLINESKIPSRITGAIGDIIPGLYTTTAILGALHYREKTGKGQMIDVSQMDSLIASHNSFTSYLMTGITSDKLKKSDGKRDVHGIYEAKDGYVVIRALGRGVWKDLDKLAQIVDCEPEELRPPSTLLNEWVKCKTRNEVVTLLSGTLPCAPVLTEAEVVNDPNTIARNTISGIEHKLGFIFKTTPAPIKFSETPIKLRTAAPLLGQHTKEVLSDILEYNKEEISNLIEEKVIDISSSDQNDNF